MFELDDKDRALLALLEANAREPMSTLARKAGMSRSTTYERLHRLEKHGIIRGYTIRRGDGIPPPKVCAYMMLYLKGPICEYVARCLETIPEIKRSDSLGGEIDMILQVEADSLDSLNRIRGAIENIRGVEMVKSGIVLAHRIDRT